MDSRRFEALSRLLGRGGTRRATLRSPASSVVAAIAVPRQSRAAACGPPICNGCRGVGEACGRGGRRCSLLCLNSGMCGCRSNGASCQRDVNRCAGARCERGICAPIAARVQTFPGNGDFDCVRGRGFVGGGQLNGPRNLAVDRTNRVYVADSGYGLLVAFVPA